MRNLSFKFVLLVLACALFASCSDDDDSDFHESVTLTELQGFWRFNYGDDPMLKTSWVDGYFEFTTDGISHFWYRVSDNKFVYVESVNYMLNGDKLTLSKDPNIQTIYTIYMNKEKQLVMKRSNGVKDYYTKYKKPDNLPYEKEESIE